MRAMSCCTINLFIIIIIIWSIEMNFICFFRPVDSTIVQVNILCRKVGDQFFFLFRLYPQVLTTKVKKKNVLGDNDILNS